MLPAEFSDVYADPETQAAFTRVYRAILSDPSPSRDRLLEAGFPMASLDPSLRALVRHRLIDMAIDGQIAPAPPESALPLFAARIEQHAAAVKSSAADLSRIYRDAREGTNPFQTEHVRLLYSIDEVGQAVAEAAGRGRSRLLAMRAPTQRIIAVAMSAPEVIATPVCNAAGVVLRAQF